MSDTPTEAQVRETFRKAHLHPDDLDLDDTPGQAFDGFVRATKIEFLKELVISVEGETSWIESNCLLGPNGDKIIAENAIIVEFLEREIEELEEEQG